MPRPLHHPLKSQITLAGVLHALGDPVRLALVKRLASCPKGGPMNCSTVAETMDGLALSTRHHHLRVLREAGLIFSQPEGKAVLNSLRREDVDDCFPGLLKVVLKSAE